MCNTMTGSRSSARTAGASSVWCMVTMNAGCAFGARMAVFAAYACVSNGCAVLVAIAPCAGLQQVRPAQMVTPPPPPFDAAISADAMEGISNKALAKRYQCSESTIERVIHRCYDEILRQRSKNPLPHVLGIDEHSIHKGRKYAVTLVDLRNHSVYEVLEGKSLETILPRIRSMPGADRVKVVCMDLSPTFRSLANRIFPQARVVADRFHVIKLIIEAFLEFCREAEPDIRWKRGITMALRKHRENLTERQRRLLAELFRKNRGIAIAHQFKEKLCRLLRLKGRTRAGCVKPLRELKRCVDELLHDAPVLFRKLGRTLREWFEPIIRMWRFTRNNGITEGFHRKMKLIQRRAYGFRNFGN